MLLRESQGTALEYRSSETLHERFKSDRPLRMEEL